jgi:hypothetical protein
MFIVLVSQSDKWTFPRRPAVPYLMLNVSCWWENYEETWPGRTGLVPEFCPMTELREMSTLAFPIPGQGTKARDEWLWAPAAGYPLVGSQHRSLWYFPMIWTERERSGWWYFWQLHVSLEDSVLDPKMGGWLGGTLRWDSASVLGEEEQDGQGGRDSLCKEVELFPEWLRVERLSCWPNCRVLVSDPALPHP